jgi:hypothetical protein
MFFTVNTYTGIVNYSLFLPKLKNHDIAHIVECYEIQV